MEQKMTRFFLYLKSIAASKTLYVTLVSMVIACILLSDIRPVSRDEITIGVLCTEGGRFSDALMTELEDTSYACVTFDDEESLKEAVLKGDADYGFCVRGDVREAVRDDDTDRTVVFYTTPFAVYGEVVKESFAGCYMAAISDYIIEDEAGNVFDTTDGDPLARLLEKNKEYSDSELLFDVNIIRTNTGDGGEVSPDDAAHSPGADYIRIVIATAVFMSIMAVYGRTYKGDMKALLCCMDRRERSINTILYMLAAALPVALAGLITGGALMGLKTVPLMGLRMILLIIYGILWAVICGRIARRSDTYAALIPVIIGLQLMFCLIYVNMRDYVPVLSVIRFLFPAGMML